MRKHENNDTAVNKRNNKSGLFWNLINVFTFFLIIALCLVGEFTTADKAYSETENRSLEQKPEISISAIKSGSFMSRFESYVSDQFPLRNTVVSSKSFIQRSLGETEQNNVFIGKDGWLFENQTPFDEEKVNKTVSAISKFSKECKIPNQVFMLVPNSTYFLKDKFPSFLTFDSQAEQIKTIYGALPEEMKKADTVKMFDGVENIEEYYYKTDHHWTTRAAKTAFDRVAPELGIDASKTKFEFHTVTNSFCGTLASSSGIYAAADKIEICIPSDCNGQYFVNNADTKTKTPSLFELSKLNQTNKYEVFAGGNFSRLTISTTNINGKNLLIFKDSYANCFIPMLTPYYQNIVVIDARYFTDNIEHVLSDFKFSDMLILYNVNTFLDDTSIKDIL